MALVLPLEGRGGSGAGPACFVSLSGCWSALGALAGRRTPGRGVTGNLEFHCGCTSPAWQCHGVGTSDLALDGRGALAGRDGLDVPALAGRDGLDVPALAGRDQALN